MASKTRKKSTRSKRKKRGTSIFVKTQRSQRLSALRRRERDRISKRLAVLLAPDAEKNARQIKRRKRGPKRFRRTINTLQGVSRNTHKADVFRREISRVAKSLGAATVSLQALREFTGLSRAEVQVASRL